MIQLLLSQIALAIGPMLHGWLRQRRALRRILDALVMISISALVIFEIAPEAVAQAGVVVLLAVMAGGIAPTLLEEVLHRTDSHTLENWTHKLAIAAAVSGLALHGTLDGAGLVTSTPSSNDMSLAVAITIHRIPVGLSIWWLLEPKFGKGVASATLLLIALTTFAGYAAGRSLAEHLSSSVVAWFQAFVAGSLIHVVFFRKHLEHD